MLNAGMQDIKIKVEEMQHLAVAHGTKCNGEIATYQQPGKPFKIVVCMLRVLLGANSCSFLENKSKSCDGIMKGTRQSWGEGGYIIRIVPCQTLMTFRIWLWGHVKYVSTVIPCQPSLKVVTILQQKSGIAFISAGGTIQPNMVTINKDRYHNTQLCWIICGTTTLPKTIF